LIGSPEVDGNIPLLMVKPFRSTKEPLVTSSAPVSLFDIPATVFDALEMDTHGVGRPVFSVKEDEARRRLTYARSVGVVPMVFIEYEVNGDAWDYGAWKHTDRQMVANQGPRPMTAEQYANLQRRLREYLDYVARYDVEE
jgi:hypothetical protein